MPDTKGSALPAANFAEGIELLGVETATTGGAKKSVRASMSAIATKVAEINGSGSAIAAATDLTAPYQMLAADAGKLFIARPGCTQVVLPALSTGQPPVDGSEFGVVNDTGGELPFGRTGAFVNMAKETTLWQVAHTRSGARFYVPVRSAASGGGGVSGPKVVSGLVYSLPLDAVETVACLAPWDFFHIWWPFVWSLPDAIVDQLYVRVLTAAGNIKLAIHEAASATGRPVTTGPLYDSGSVAIGAAGLRPIGSGAAIPLKQGGIYWASAAFSTAAAALRFTTICADNQNDINGNRVANLKFVNMVGRTLAQAEANTPPGGEIQAGIGVAGTIAGAWTPADLANNGQNRMSAQRVPLIHAKIA
jgi:hypothetical protein